MVASEVGQIRPHRMASLGVDIGKDVSRLVSRRAVTMDQICTFLIEQRITFRRNVAALCVSLIAILDNRSVEMSLHMQKLILRLQPDWIWLDTRIGMTTSEIKEVSEAEADCRRPMTVPGIGSLISAAVFAAVGQGKAYDRGRDFAAWLGLNWCRDNTTQAGALCWNAYQPRQSVFAYALCASARAIPMRLGNWPYFRFGSCLEASSTRMPKGKPAVLLTDKLAWSVLNSGRGVDRKEHQMPAAV